MSNAPAAAGGRLQPVAKKMNKKPAKKTERATAVREGIIPKARRGFAKFLAERSMGARGAGKRTKAEHQEVMKRLSAEWNNSTDIQREFAQKSAQEFERQREAMREVGLRVRGETAQLAPEKQDPEQDALPMPRSFGAFTLKEQAISGGGYGVVQVAYGAQGRLHVLKLYRNMDGAEDARHEAQMLAHIRAELHNDQALCYFCHVDRVEDEASLFHILCWRTAARVSGSICNGTGHRARTCGVGFLEAVGLRCQGAARRPTGSPGHQAWEHLLGCGDRTNETRRLRVLRKGSHTAVSLPAVCHRAIPCARTLQCQHCRPQAITRLPCGQVGGWCDGLQCRHESFSFRALEGLEFSRWSCSCLAQGRGRRGYYACQGPAQALQAGLCRFC